MAMDRENPFSDKQGHLVTVATQTTGRGQEETFE